MLQRAFDALEPMFIEQVLPASGHGLLAEPVQWTMLLQSMPEAAAIVRDKLAKEWSKDHSTLPAEKWVDLKRHLAIFCSAKAGTNKSQKSISSKDISRLENWPCEVVFRHTYPRLDINVSKMRNHLLKSPFCVHPKTGRVCVPFQAAHVDSFDPFTVPTLPQLQKELDENSGVDTVHDWQKTSLKPYFEAFEKEFLEPLTFELRKQQRDAKEQEAALIGDF
jgi:DNA primase small subunit